MFTSRPTCNYVRFYTMLYIGKEMGRQFVRHIGTCIVYRLYILIVTKNSLKLVVKALNIYERESKNVIVKFN